jgi:tetrahedral aminopeptidase
MSNVDGGSTALEYLRALVDLNGVSGAEEDVIRAMVRMARPLADQVEVDPFGNVIATRNAEAPEARRVAVAVHMDEVGYRIRAIEENGFLRFEKIGGIDNRVSLAQRVWVSTPSGRVLGVVGTKSAHLLSPSDRTSVPEHSEQYIDVGASDAAQAREMGIRLGAQAGFHGPLTELGAGTGRYTAHALDDRVGCAVALAALHRFRDTAPPVTIVVLCTVQEEVGLRGAQAAIQGHAADIGIAVDTTATDDTPELPSRRLLLGAGAAIKVFDFSTLSHPAIRHGMAQAAERAGIAAQEEILMGIGTDAGALQFGGSGIPTGTISIGTRYTHSPVEVLDERDLEGAVELLVEFLRVAADLDLRFVEVD